jgi:glutamine amidotransferase-like uncharacterized protein
MAMLFILKLIVASLFVSFVSSNSAWANTGAPLALVYNGNGVCPGEDDCAGAAAAVARAAGFRVRYVSGYERDLTIFNQASVWIQPGGVAATMSESMSYALKQAIRSFVNNGGGYVGFCAGAFLATNMVGTTSVPGLGIFPGRTQLVEGIYSAYGVILPMTWAGTRKHIYFEGGPHMIFSPRSNIEPRAYFDDGTIGSARTNFGMGRVYITGAHPEAPADWREEPYLLDVDGVDINVGVDMVNWAAGITQ